jgi:hypothetical protein
MNRRIERIQRQHARTFLEKSLRVGARRTKGGAFSRPSIYDGIEQHLFLIKEYEDRIGYADKPDKLRVLMEAAGMSEEEAWKRAESNTIEDTEEQRIEDALGVPEEVKEKSPFQTYVISNKEGYYGAGAATIRVERFLRKHGTKSMAVLPSSLHEMLIIPGVTADDLCGLTEIVRDVNTTEVEQEDRLIDRAYIVKLGEGGNAVARG